MENYPPPSKGLRVTATDWVGHKPETGKGYIGTIVQHDIIKTELKTLHEVKVQWDNDVKTVTFYPGNEKLYCLDLKPIGIDHEKKCSGCDERILGYCWQCANCFTKDSTDFSLCSKCYHDDNHSIDHKFYRRDNLDPHCKELVSARRSASRCKLRGLYKGASVELSHTQEEEYAVLESVKSSSASLRPSGSTSYKTSASPDGTTKVVRGKGDRKSRSVTKRVGKVVGLVKERRNENFNSAVVEWKDNTTDAYRMGLHGKVDLKVIKSVSGPSLYVEHLQLPWRLPDKFQLQCRYNEYAQLDPRADTADSDGYLKPISTKFRRDVVTQDFVGDAEQEATVDLEAESQLPKSAVVMRPKLPKLPPRRESTHSFRLGGKSSPDLLSDKVGMAIVQPLIRISSEPSSLSTLVKASKGNDREYVHVVNQKGLTIPASQAASHLGRHSAGKPTNVVKPVTENKLWKMPRDTTAGAYIDSEGRTVNQGDKVVITADLERAKSLQKSYAGGWDPWIDKVSGQIGRVMNIDHTGGVNVMFKDHFGLLNPAILTVLHHVVHEEFL